MTDQLEVTQDRIVADLRTLGVVPGDVLLVHSSLKSLGHVQGGPNTLIDALLEAIGVQGTLVFPAYTGGKVENVGLDASQRKVYTGIIPETARRRPDFLYSPHPFYGIAARGPLAAELVRLNNTYVFPSAERKFIYLMMRAGGKALLVGVTHEANSTIHLVEEFAGLDYKVQDKAWWPLEVEKFLLLPADEQRMMVARHSGAALPYRIGTHFTAIEEPLVRAGKLTIGKVGAAECRLMRMLDVVEVGLAEVRRNPWFLKTRPEKL